MYQGMFQSCLIPTQSERFVPQLLLELGIGHTLAEQVFSVAFQIATRHNNIVRPLLRSQTKSVVRRALGIWGFERSYSILEVGTIYCNKNPNPSRGELG